jgi:hypothetical protein
MKTAKKKSQKNEQSALASPQDFRKWLARCIVVLETDPVKVSRRADLGVNTTGSFLREDRDIRLSVAIKLHGAVCSMALENEKQLPPLRGVGNA